MIVEEALKAFKEDKISRADAEGVAMEATKKSHEAHKEAHKEPLLISLLDMPLKDFARSKKTFDLKSNLLGENIIIAADNAPESVYDRGKVVYTAIELNSICSMSSVQVKKIHKTKKAFEGFVTVEPSPELAEYKGSSINGTPVPEETFVYRANNKKIERAHEGE